MSRSGLPYMMLARPGDAACAHALRLYASPNPSTRIGRAQVRRICSRAPDVRKAHLAAVTIVEAPEWYPSVVSAAKARAILSRRGR